MSKQTQLRHYEKSVVISAKVDDVFDYIDDHKRFSSHMNQSSWMLGGGKMNTSVDEKNGQKVGSHIRMDGTVFGVYLFLDEVVTHHEPPRLKTWKTVGTPKLLIIGNYQMKIEIKSDERGSLISVSIDYELPKTNVWLGKLFSGWYAKWCVQQMLKGTSNYFAHNNGGEE
jgi:hypothetical protein